VKILSWNVNGLRSVYKKGFVEWLENSNADIVCLQETKANENQLTYDLLYPAGYEAHFNSAEKKGYSGVAVYTKKSPEQVEKTFGMDRFDTEGRYLRLEYEKYVLMNFYVPNGGRDKKDYDYKLNFYAFLLEKLKQSRDKNIIIVGDFNIAHKEIDLARPKDNVNNIMFTPKERQKITDLLECGYIDTFRIHTKEGGFYSWWAYFNNARERNIGWRIDYVFVSKPLKAKVKKAFILKEITGSDHCPVGIDIYV